ncbi:hypothetical protein Clacol_005985 [Clathrus columnatus]|uniref:Uncharacterized protein n=1 Tax=Clathrus columnatus TaxID=1419009 RepID=A0AAV5AAT5_9AGAM|nr:hypothetical protein Clacol_005985 [Clathrus columnatus]
MNTYGQDRYVVIKIQNKSKVKNIVIKNVKLEHDDKNATVPESEINNSVIPSNSSYLMSACGKFKSFNGTKGSFDLYEEEASEKLIGTFDWYCPETCWPRKCHNHANVKEGDPSWSVEAKGFHIEDDDKPLDNETITCIEK